MSIHFISGRPGAGKGLYCMRLLVAELRGTNRKICTNFPLKPNELNTYLHEEYGEGFGLLDRLVDFCGDKEKEHLKNFYRIRQADSAGQPVYLDEELDEKGRSIGYDIDGAQSGGVYYLLDEVHIVFGARQWMELGRAVMFYATQHRKLGDDVIMISQQPKQVDSQFRGLAQDFSVLRNHGMEKFFCFKQPNMFSRNTFLNMPSGASNSDALETSAFTLDLKQADCYETERGVGLAKKEGLQGDVGKDKRKGLPWWVAIVIVLVIAGLAFWIPVKLIPSLAKDRLVTAKTSVDKMVVEKIKGHVLDDVNGSQKVDFQPPVEVKLEPEIVDMYSDKVVTGWGFHSGTKNFFVILSDFSRLSLDNGGLKRVLSQHCEGADGTLYRYEFGYLNVNRIFSP